MTDAHERLAALYRGQTHVWGAVHGEQVKRNLTRADWHEHVHGEGSVGVYPLVRVDGVWSVAWCGVDVDEGYDLINIALNIRNALKHLGIHAWVERSKGKGYHTLCFIDGWVAATAARQAMQLACQVVEYRPKEIYPKQTELAEGQSGNYLNAAYSRKWVKQGKRIMLGHWGADPSKPFGSGWYGLPAFLDEAEANLNAPAVIAKAAALYKPPPPPRPVHITKPTVDPTPRLRGVARKLFEEGPLPSLNTGTIDRSAALQRLAHLLRTDGFAAGEAYHLLVDFDQRLGKYVGRADAELQYRRIVERAYG